MDKNLSFFTIIQHIQNDLLDIIRDYSNNSNSLKLKVISIKGKIVIKLKETLKILNVKLTPLVNEENRFFDKFQEEIENFKVELGNQKSVMENQITNLKQDNNELKFENENLRKNFTNEENWKEINKKKEESKDNNRSRVNNEDYYNKLLIAEDELLNYKINFDQIISILREEEKNKLSNEEEICSLNQNISCLKDDIISFSCKLDKKCQDYEILDKINTGYKYF